MWPFLRWLSVQCSIETGDSVASKMERLKAEQEKASIPSKTKEGYEPASESLQVVIVCGWCEVSERGGEVK